MKYLLLVAFAALSFNAQASLSFRCVPTFGGSHWVLHADTGKVNYAQAEYSYINNRHVWQLGPRDVGTTFMLRHPESEHNDLYILNIFKRNKSPKSYRVDSSDDAGKAIKDFKDFMQPTNTHVCTVI